MGRLLQTQLRVLRRLTASPLRRAAIAFLTGALMVSSAWAGASLVPVPAGDSGGANATAAADRERDGAGPEPAAAPAPGGPIDPASLPEGQVLAGAAKTSILPRPDDYGGTWETRRECCATLSAEGFQGMLDDPVERADHLASTGSPWPENPNCIYMGGFGLGPMNPVTSWNEELGLWVRAVALRDRDGDDLVLVVLDGEGYFWDYGSKCDDCGIKQLTEQLADDEELGLEAEDIVVAATHAHSSPDFIGGWGFVPDWYMEQVADTIKGTVRDAVAAHAPGGPRVRRADGAPVQQRAPRHLPLGRGAAARVAARVRARPDSAGAAGRPRPRRSPRSARTPPTRPPSARTAARPTPTGPACSRPASRSASAASASTS